jgi:hypothetical protein
MAKRREKGTQAELDRLVNGELDRDWKKDFETKLQIAIQRAEETLEKPAPQKHEFGPDRRIVAQKLLYLVKTQLPDCLARGLDEQALVVAMTIGELERELRSLPFPMRLIEGLCKVRQNATKAAKEKKSRAEQENERIRQWLQKRRSKSPQADAANLMRAAQRELGNQGYLKSVRPRQRPLSKDKYLRAVGKKK